MARPNSKARPQELAPLRSLATRTRVDDVLTRCPVPPNAEVRIARASSWPAAVRAAPGRAVARPQAVHVLEEDPELATLVCEPERQAALSVAIAPCFELPRGPWGLLPPADPAALGALILDGLLIVRVEGADRAHVELLGEGDVISPWLGSGADVNVPSEVSARVVSPLRVALLDGRFALRIARWPGVYAILMRRLVIRTRRLSLQAAINAVPRVEERVELTLWQLGDRFGRVTTDGILLRLFLTHQLLGELVGAERPSVSTALCNLERRQRIVRPSRDQWILRGEPPARLRALTRKVGLRA
jgi:CRP/FNR family transcriptional regulator, cyclic AMP receptor protein